MALWLEHRDENGELVFRGRFVSGSVDSPLDHEPLSVGQAIQLAKLSAHQPLLEKRAWALRVDPE